MWTPESRAAALQAWWGDCRTYWQGVEVLKHPNDLFSMQEVIWETKPDLVVETGTWKGGSALFYAGLGVDVISVDKAVARTPPEHSNITYIRGLSTSPRTVYLVNQAAIDRRVMVCLDADHAKQSVLDELAVYAPLVSSGCYLVVEDTCLGRIVSPERKGDGPADALDDWLSSHPEFTPDPHRERFGPTMHPGGWLLRS